MSFTPKTGASLPLSEKRYGVFVCELKLTKNTYQIFMNE